MTVDPVPVAWHPTHPDEMTSTGVDRFAGRTFETDFISLSGVLGKVKPVDEELRQTHAAIFVSWGARKNPDRNNVIVYFGAWRAGEFGLNASQVGQNDAVTHGLRRALDDSDWILICLPGGEAGPRGQEIGTFHTIDDNAIKACLLSAGRPERVDRLHLCAFSRGHRGLRETLNRQLIASPKPELVTIFDAAYADLEKAITEARIPGNAIRAYQVTVKRRILAKNATNVNLDPIAMRAIGFSRAIQDIIFQKYFIFPLLLTIPSEIQDQLLALPPRGKFSSGISFELGQIRIDEWLRQADVARKINSIVRNEKTANGLLTFIEKLNLLFLERRLPAETYSHHLFVAEFAHELVPQEVDPTHGKRGPFL